MIQGFYTASTALNYRQKAINVSSNNIANVNTTAFKSSSAKFKNSMYSAYLKEYPDNVNTHYQIGTGSYIDRIDKNMEQGSLIQTASVLDIAIEGEGFTAVGKNSGEIYYIRGGSFVFEPVPGGKRIAYGDGSYLLNRNAEPIIIPSDITDLKIDETGRVLYEGQTTEQNIMTVTFANNKNLEMFEKGLFMPTQNSGPPVNSDIIIRQGYLETSNVDVAKEMTDLIKHQRIFQLNARVLTTIDEMSSMANKLRR
jgi:flagellar basal-body rod protein FlgG